MSDCLEDLEERMIRFFLTDIVNNVEEDIKDLDVRAEIDFIRSGVLFRKFTNREKIFVIFESRKDYNTYMQMRQYEGFELFYEIKDEQFYPRIIKKLKKLLTIIF